jgi:hypothetical protein
VPWLRAIAAVHLVGALLARAAHMDRSANTGTNWEQLELVAPDDATMEEDHATRTGGGPARLPTLLPTASAASTHGFDAELRSRVNELVASVSMSPEDLEERADWRQDLYEMAWRSEAPRFLGDERQGVELYPAPPKMASEAPGPMTRDVVMEATEQPTARVTERAGAGVTARTGERRAVLAQGVAFVALCVLVGSAIGTIHHPSATTMAVPRPTMAAVGAPDVAPSAPSVAAVATPMSPDLREPPMVTTVTGSPAPTPAVQAPRPATTAAVAGPATAVSGESAAGGPKGIPAVFMPTPVAAWLQPPAGPFSRSGAAVELARLAGRARACGAADADGPVTADVHVTFAPSGRATTASVSGALAGTAVGGCVARVFRGASVPAFDGEAVTVHRTVALR